MAEIKKLLDDAIETEINNLNSASDTDEKSEVKLLSLAGVVLGGIGTLLSGWADNKEQEAIIEEKVNEALAARNEEEES